MYFIYVSAFLSGVAALIYQVAWQRVLGLFTGADVISTTIVVTTFLCGLGIGSLISMKSVDRLSPKKAILFYGAVNLAISLFGFLSIYLFYDVVYIKLAESISSLAGLIGLVFFALLFPTVLMGLSLPLLARVTVLDFGKAVRTISNLNGLNIAGSVVGTLVGTWYLIGTYGYRTTTYLGATFSLLASLLGLVSLFSMRLGSATNEKVGEEVKISGAALSLRNSPALLAWCFFSLVIGFLSISYELIWFRLLSIYIKSNAYLFGHLLAFILCGYSLGNFLGAKYAHRFKDTKQGFLTILVGVGSYVLVSVFLASYFYSTIANFSGAGLFVLDPGTGLHKVFANLIRYLILPAFILLPPNILIGFAFPVIQEGIQKDRAVVGGALAAALSFNIVGNVLGGLLTGIILFDFLGSFGAITLLALSISLFCVIAILFFNPAQVSLSTNSRFLVFPVALSAVAFLTPNQAVMMRYIHEVSPSEKRLFLSKEDRSGIASVVQYPKAQTLRLFVNGIGESELPPTFGHIALGALPVLVHPNPQKTLSIGIGSGATPYFLGMNPKTKMIRGIEIVSAQWPVLDQVKTDGRAALVSNLFSDPRYVLSIGDGRRFLSSTSELFDVIEVDAIKPGRAFSGVIYSAEFFELAKRRLAPGGILCQWKATERVLWTVANVFPHVVVIENGIILASTSPIEFNRENVFAQLSSPSAVNHLERIGADVGFFQKWARTVDVKEILPENYRQARAINTDLIPRDEFYMNNPIKPLEHKEPSKSDVVLGE